MCGIDQYIEEVAAAGPFPGGGSVAALAGSLAAALGEMMAGLTERRQKFAVVHAQAMEIRSELADLRKNFRLLMKEDSDAFQLLLDAIRLPGNNDADKARRDAAMEQAAKDATVPPLRMARAALEVLRYQETLIRIGNPNVVCDAAIGAQMAYASIKGAQYNVLANTSGIKDRAFIARSRAEISDLLGEAHSILSRIDKAVIHT